MKKIKRVNISVYEDDWNELPKYIDVNRSEWIRQQVRKQITINDDVEKIDLQIEAINYQLKTLSMDLESLVNQKEEIKKERERNEEDKKLINDAMFTIQTIVDNQSYIEISRVKHIANKKVLDFNILLAKCDELNIEVRDNDIIKEELTGFRTGKRL